MAKISPALFVRQVRQETSKVTWPTRKDTAVATATVFILATLAAIFFLLVDQIIGWGVASVIGLGT